MSVSQALPASPASLGGASDTAPRAVTPVDEAITRSQSFLLAEQKPEGFWVGELMVDATLVADMVAFYHWWDKVDPEWQR